MDTKYADVNCFVIMPFGDKPDPGQDGKVIHFDEIYHMFIKSAVEELGIKCVRCDEIGESGWIHSKMFTHIYDSEVAVVDITALNPNVFYELGVRHVLKKNVTVLIRQAGTRAPFNIQGFNIIEYKADDPVNMKDAAGKIQELIKNGMASVNVDSPVYEVLDNLRVENKPKLINKKELHTFPLAKVPGKQLGIITGDIQNIKEADVWVNSENTNMQMARPFERSISAVIRYMGAKKNRAGRITEDTVSRELFDATGGTGVDPAVVIDTTAGELTASNNVKKIFHAAAVVGQVGLGYSPIEKISECVRNALKLVDDARLANDNLKTILFPLMGTGTSKKSAQEVAGELIEEAISYLEENPQSKAEIVYFLAYNEQDLELCQRIMKNNARLTSPPQSKA